jgi:hypothetical protein
MAIRVVEFSNGGNKIRNFCLVGPVSKSLYVPAPLHVDAIRGGQ